VTVRERHRLFAAVVAAILAVALAGCGSGGDGASAKAGGSGKAPAKGKLAAPALEDPPKPAPPIRLKDSLGHTVSLSQYRGKAVLLTFIYTHCPDVCPLIVSSLHNALAQLGPDAAKAQVIAVSVDPKGDTKAAVATFLRQHKMTGRMEYLVGSKKQLAPVWRRWGVAVQSTPDAREVDHSAFVYGITGSGKVRALYPSNFKAATVAHDVPILAAG
jgi:protein SCO1/2